MNAREYLEQHCLRSHEDIDAFLKLDYRQRYDTRGYGWTYDSELGWVLVDSVRDDGIDGSNTFYHYEPSGCRRRAQDTRKQSPHDKAARCMFHISLTSLFRIHTFKALTGQVTEGEPCRPTTARKSRGSGGPPMSLRCWRRDPCGIVLPGARQRQDR